MEQTVSKANFTQGLVDIMQDLPKLSTALHGVQGAAGTLSPTLALLPVRFSGISTATATAVQATATYKAAIGQLVTQAVDILTMNTKLGGS